MSTSAQLMLCFALMSCISILEAFFVDASALLRGMALLQLGVMAYCWIIVYRQIVRPVTALHAYVRDLELGGERSEPPPFVPTGNRRINVIQSHIERRVRATYECLNAQQKARDEAETYLTQAQKNLQLAESSDVANKELLKAMATLAVQVRGLSREVHNALSELSINIAEIDNSVEKQHLELGKTSVVLEGILSSVREVAHRAETVASMAEDGQSKASTGVEDVQRTTEMMENVKGSILALKNTMQQLGTEAENIGTVMQVISDVADQTNLLALNAAIEAARAGEAGRGFAVVADEVRKLAERTLNATQEVARAVGAIQRQTRQNIEAVETTAGQTVQGAELVARLGAFMTEIIENMSRSSGYMQEIAEATRMQAQSSQEAGGALESINASSRRTAGNMSIITSSVLEVAGHVDGMESIIQSLASGDMNIKQQEKLVQWTPKIATGVRIIDEQHKVLCNMINDLHASLLASEADSVMHKILEGLERYAKTHFDTEEALYTNSEYPYTKEHKKIHRSFEAKVADVKEQLRAGRSSVSHDLLLFLKNWLIDHIQGTDLGYAKYISGQHKG